MKTFYNDQAKPLLKFFTKTKSELVNLKLKQILNEGFISKPQGIFLKAAIRKRQKFEQNKTQNEWSINEIVVFESEYESCEEYFSDVGSFVVRLADKFRTSGISEEIVLLFRFRRCSLSRWIARSLNLYMKTTMRAQTPLTLKFTPKEKTTKFYYIKIG